MCQATSQVPSVGRGSQNQVGDLGGLILDCLRSAQPQILAATICGFRGFTSDPGRFSPETETSSFRLLQNTDPHSGQPRARSRALEAPSRTPNRGLGAQEIKTEGTLGRAASGNLLKKGSYRGFCVLGVNLLTQLPCPVSRQCQPRAPLGSRCSVCK